MVTLARVLSFASVLSALACADTLELNLDIQDPCDRGSALASAQHLEVLVEADGVHESAVWSRSEGTGSLEELPPLENALVSVIGRSSTGGGAPGESVAAGAVGFLQLAGEYDGEPVSVAVTVGAVNGFHRTTNAANPRECTSLLTERQGHTATLLSSGKVLVVGGYRRNAASDTYWSTTELWEPATGRFGRGAAMKWQRADHTATALADGRVLVAGGRGPWDDDGNASTPPVEQTLWVALLYDGERGVFTTTVKMQEQRAHHTATLLADGRVLLAGGTREGVELATTEVFDPATNSFSAGPTMSEPRAFHAAVRVGRSTVAVIGGRGSGGVLDKVEFVTVGQGSTVQGPTLSLARSHVAAALVPGQDALVVAGGFSGVTTSPWLGTGVSNIDIIALDPQNLAASRRVCTNVRLAQARGDAAIGVTPTGLVVVGGVGEPLNVSQPLQGSAILASAEVLRFGSIASCSVNLAASANDLAVGRGGAQATTLAGGDLLVTGGYLWVEPGAGEPTRRAGSVGPAEVYIRRR